MKESYWCRDCKRRVDKKRLIRAEQGEGHIDYVCPGCGFVVICKLRE